MIRLLIADDDSVSRKILERNAPGWGFKTFAAQNGRQAFEILKKKKIHIAVLDWMMPEITGIELSERIRENRSSEYQYIILLTSRNNPEDIIKGLNAGADDYITKPFNIRELEARLKIGKRIIDLQNQLLISQRKLYRLAIHDSLTGLHNRGEILRNLKQAFIQTKRENQQLALILLDIDHFKKINDDFGHQNGDLVLTELARRLKPGIRPYDRIGRYGGEEFLVVLPGCNIKTISLIAERLREKISQRSFRLSDRKMRVTISLGCVVTDHSGNPSMKNLLRQSDKALYRAKHSGRNRVCLAANDMFDEN